MKSIKLKDLYLGKIDAKNELLTNTDSEKKRFVDNFLLPPNINLDKFTSGDTYFITGLKGIGKTALLRYISIITEKNENTYNSFVLFKSQFTEDDRKDFSKAGRTTLVNENTDDFEGSDYENVWSWFLHRHIVETIETNNLYLFECDHNWEKYKSCVLAPNVGSDKWGFKNLFPKLRKGSVEISSSPKLGIEFDWVDDNKTRVKFSSIVKQAENLFLKMYNGNDILNIYIDELEINLGNQKKYKRDILLIRDLIIAIERLNSICKVKKFNIRTLASIRSEVLTSVSSLGKEINKIISDFGTHINWSIKLDDQDDHPLVEIIIKKIVTSERNHNIESESDSKIIWDKYFQKSIHKQSSKKYILDQTWYRPRDIVRLLNIANDQFPNRDQFSQHVFDTIKKQYSTDSWTEITEELIARYTIEEILAIKTLLYGFQHKFSFKEISKRLSEFAELYPEVKSLENKFKISTILTDLYRIGVIGNILHDRRNQIKLRFSFRGDDQVLLDKEFTIHNALKHYFSV